MQLSSENEMIYIIELWFYIFTFKFYMEVWSF